jgi:hypothetical protein
MPGQNLETGHDRFIPHPFHHSLVLLPFDVIYSELLNINEYMNFAWRDKKLEVVEGKGAKSDPCRRLLYCLSSWLAQYCLGYI